MHIDSYRKYGVVNVRTKTIVADFIESLACGFLRCWCPIKSHVIVPLLSDARLNYGPSTIVLFAPSAETCGSAGPRLKCHTASQAVGLCNDSIISSILVTYWTAVRLGNCLTHRPNAINSLEPH